MKIFIGLLIAYVLLTVAILLKTPVLDVDSWIVNQHLRQEFAAQYDWIHTYVMLGQRRVLLQLLLPFLVWVTLRDRSPKPLLSLAVAIVMLNLSVGVVKLITGRQGPRYGRPVDDIFAHGDIYPSGHTSNAVVMYGLVAMFVAVKYRKAAIGAAAFMCVSVGAGTLFINTHWVTDVVGGWLAGGLVLCAVPWVVPLAQRAIVPSYSRTRVALSVVGAALPLYFNLNWLTSMLGPWLNNVFGGWLAAGLLLSALPWLTPPLERRLVAAWTAVRARSDKPLSGSRPKRMPVEVR